MGGGLPRPASGVRRSLLVRGLVGLIAAALIGLQSVWSGNDGPLVASTALIGWLILSSLPAAFSSRSNWRSGVLAIGLFGDCFAAAAVVRATGSLHSPALLILALPILAGGLLFFWRVGFLLGLLTAALYGVLALEQAPEGTFPRELLVLVVFHGLFFSSMGVAAGWLAKRMASSLREAAQSRSELEAVRLSTDRIVESLSCGLVVTDASGEVRTLNPETRRLLGLAEDALHLPGPVAERNAPFLKMLADGLHGEFGNQDVELTLWNAQGGHFPASVKIAPVIDASGRTRGLVGLFWDICERKRLEEFERQRERMATIGELSAGLAHEIRNSLKPISGSIELLQARVDLPPEIEPLMELITRESDSLEAFLSQFLALARDKTLKLERLDLEDLIREEVRALKVGRSWDERTVQVSGEPGLSLTGDREWLRQAFRNVILNALEAVPEGKVDVFLERFEEHGNAWVRIRVVDEGPGLQELDERDAFGPFRTTKPSGSGLGLPIALRGVQEHGGRIAFAPQWARGGCVLIELPQTATSSTGPVEHAA